MLRYLLPFSYYRTKRYTNRQQTDYKNTTHLRFTSNQAKNVNSWVCWKYSLKRRLTLIKIKEYVRNFNRTESQFQSPRYSQQNLSLHLLSIM